MNARKEKPEESTEVANADAVANFEKALTELEKVVTDMENGELDLQESLKRFERGIALVRQCQTALDTAQLKIEEMSGSEAGNQTGDDA